MDGLMRCLHRHEIENKRCLQGRTVCGQRIIKIIRGVPLERVISRRENLRGILPPCKYARPRTASKLRTDLHLTQGCSMISSPNAKTPSLLPMSCKVEDSSLKCTVLEFRTCRTNDSIPVNRWRAETSDPSSRGMLFKFAYARVNRGNILNAPRTVSLGSEMLR
jgi:hypothetical protein